MHQLCATSMVSIALAKQPTASAYSHSLYAYHVHYSCALTQSIIAPADYTPFAHARCLQVYAKVVLIK